MTLEERINLLVKLGDYLQKDTDERQLAILSAERHNRWLTKPNSMKALTNLASEFLNRQKLENWLSDYPDLNQNKSIQKVGVVLAGNIPAVGFHDILCVFLSGHHTVIKLSDKDSYLIPFMIDFLVNNVTG